MERYVTVNATVLKITEYSESSRILSALSAEYGLIGITCKGVRRGNSRELSGAQPFTFCKYKLFKGKGELYTLVSSELIESFYELSADVDRFMEAGEIAKTVRAVARENFPEPELLSLYLNTLFALSYTQKPRNLISAVFAVRLRALMGILPEPESLAERWYPEGESGSAKKSALVQALRHITGCELKDLYGFKASEELAALICGGSEMLKRED
mgnify:CR=1 FL=1